MKIGLVLPQWNQSMAGVTPSASDVVAFARSAEAIGLDAFWLTDHIYHEPYLDFLAHGYELPADQQGIRGGFWECWTMLAALASNTERAEIGTLVTNTAFRNPALLANMAETVDSLSGGRLSLGLGAGDFRSEHDFHGYPWEQRVGRFEEALQIIVPMLRGETVTHEGAFYQVQDAALLPRGQRPDGPPVLIGSMRAGPRMQRLTAQYADGWSCWLVFEDSHAGHFAERLRVMRDACERYGRDPDTLLSAVAIGVTAPEYAGFVPGASPLTGTPEEVAAEIHQYVELGVDQLAIYLQPCNEAGLDWLGQVLEPIRERA